MGFMEKKGLYHFFNVLLILAVMFLAVAVSGCSSDDDDNDSGSDPLITYSGITTAVTITKENAADIVAGSSPVGMAFDMEGLLESSQTGSGEIYPDDLTMRSMQVFEDTVNRFDLYTMISEGSLRAASVSESDTSACDGGGTVTATLTYEDENALNTQQDYTLSFHNCVDKGITLAGTGSLSVTYDSMTDFLAKKYNTLTQKFIDFVIVEDGYYVWLKNYTIYEEYIDTGFTQTSSGQIYFSEYGYVIVSTDAVFETDSGSDYAKAGVLIVTGAQGTGGGSTKARLTALDATTYAIDVDTNGDGTYNETSTALPWTSF